MVVFGMLTAARSAGRRNPDSTTGYRRLERNKQRDQDSRIALEAMGWKVLAVWQCQTKDLGQLENRLADFLDGENADRHSGRKLLA